MRSYTSFFVSGLMVVAAGAVVTPAPHAGAAEPAPSARAAAVRQIQASAPTQAELDRAVTSRQRLGLLARCVDLGATDYCLQVGVVDDASDPALWRALEGQLDNRPSRTGDMSLAQRLAQVAALDAGERERLEVDEVSRAVTAVSEAARSRSAGRAPGDPDPGDGVGTIKRLSASDARRQVKSYYCGPATLQMIDGADDNTFDTQASWAADLGTESAGATWIGDMVSQINAKTVWDNVNGSFTIRSVATWTADRYWAEVTEQISQGAPYVEHPKLHSDYFSYLSTPTGYGGHFQVGRGWQRVADGTRYVHIFEPYNEPDWSGYTTQTWGERRVQLSKALAANKANQDNIGIPA